MLQNSDYISGFMAFYGYPKEVVREFERLQKRAESDPAFGIPLENLVLAYGRDADLPPTGCRERPPCSGRMRIG